MIMFKNKSRKFIFAFSLIELSIVMIIIGLLASITIGGQKLVWFAKVSKARQLTNDASFILQKSLVLWLEPTLKSSFKDINDVDVVLDNGDGVAQWVNQAYTDMNPVQATSSNQPTFTSDGIGGIPTLRFDGNDYLEFASASIPAMNPNEFTMFIVCSALGGQGAYRSLITSRSNIPGRSGYMFYANSVNTWDVVHGTGASYVATTSTTGVALNTPSVLTGERNASTTKIYVNNALEDSDSSAFVKNTVYPARIGTGQTESFPTFFWNGDVSEIIIFNKALSSTERTEIYDYLAEKYSIE